MLFGNTESHYISLVVLSRLIHESDKITFMDKEDRYVIELLGKQLDVISG